MISITAWDVVLLEFDFEVKNHFKTFPEHYFDSSFYLDSNNAS